MGTAQGQVWQALGPEGTRCIATRIFLAMASLLMRFYACPLRRRSVHSAASSAIASSSSGFDQISMVRRLPTRTLRGGLMCGLPSEPDRSSPPLAAASSRSSAKTAGSSSGRPVPLSWRPA